MRPSSSNSPDAVVEYLTRRSAMEMPLIARAIGAAARAGGMAEVAREAGLSQENLYRSLNSLTGRLGLYLTQSCASSAPSD